MRNFSLANGTFRYDADLDSLKRPQGCEVGGPCKEFVGNGYFLQVRSVPSALFLCNGEGKKRQSLLWRPHAGVAESYLSAQRQERADRAFWSCERNGVTPVCRITVSDHRPGFPWGKAYDVNKMR